MDSPREFAVSAASRESDCVGCSISILLLDEVEVLRRSDRRDGYLETAEADLLSDIGAFHGHVRIEL